MKWIARSLLGALALLAAVPAAAQGRPPLVLAAASLQEALNAAADGWARRGHARPVLSFAASSALARQVDAGAPADLFLSADEDWMDFLARRGRLRAGTRADFAGNALVLVAPAARPQRLAVRPGFALGRALGGGRLAVGSVEAVPAGRYARQALERLRVWPQVEGRLAQAESVRAALALVARGEAPLGVVYATDALAEPKVMVAGRFPAASHAPIRYPLALLAGAGSGDAEGFRRYLLGAEGRAILRRFGFGAP
ncbi:MAG: molybdate ABC transporter substrate-binding protein [Sphingomonadales bacterium]|nr:molybdate ABC transporter substrate-binding protein [Sphingomonadales bacterium]